MTFAHPLALAAAIPWIVVPLVSAWRMRQSRDLRDESPDTPSPVPRVSVVIPARNEARNIATCVNALLASSYPALEIVVVNDHSADATGEIVSAIAARDARVRVIANPELPAGWFGKQWACAHGAAATAGDILIFVDADARAAPDLVARSVNGMQRTRAELYTVASRQEMGTFWERLVQPQVFALLSMRYGGTEIINRSPRTTDKIANGQYLMIRRSAYDALDGHALVRGYVAEDLMLAQKYFAAGRKTVMVMGEDQLVTRMYTSLPEIVAGWRKNVFAGGRDAVPMGRLGLALFPFVLPLPAVLQLVPVMALLVALLAPVPVGLLLWGAVTTLALIAWWIAVYRRMRVPLGLAFCFPLGAAVFLYITASAVMRGSAVEWKGRSYQSGESEARP